MIKIFNSSNTNKIINQFRGFNYFNNNILNKHYRYHSSCCSNKNSNNNNNNQNNNNNNNQENNISNNNQNIRVRYAPSPTGYLHLGGLRTALFNYLFAKKNGGKFLLRIEDTDRTRFVEGSAKNLANCLEWAGIPYDEGPDRPGNCGPYIQSERLSIYKKYAKQLLDEGHAYHCFCTPERLALSRIGSKSQNGMSLYDRHCLKLSKEEIDSRLANNEPHTIRLKIPTEKTTKFTDIVKGKVSFNNQLIDDQVLMKSDGFPTYHLASVVDDHLMGISHVIRGEEWLNSTPKHIILYESFGWEPPKFAHVPLLLNTDKSKLSKRQGDVSVDSYMAKGFLPEALVNFVALLGWSPHETTQEVFTLNELIDQFSLDGLNKSGSVVNMEKLDWFNVVHIRKQLDNPSSHHLILPQIKEQIKEFYNGDGGDNDQYLLKAIHCVKERVHIIENFNQLLKPFFNEVDFNNEETQKMKQKVWKGEQSKQNVNLFIDQLKQLNDFNSQNIYKTLQLTCSDFIYKDQNLNEKELTSKVNQLMSNLRYLLLGSSVGGGIPVAIETFGKEKSINRLLNALNKN